MASGELGSGRAGVEVAWGSYKGLSKRGFGLNACRAAARYYDKKSSSLIPY